MHPHAGRLAERGRQVRRRALLGLAGEIAVDHGDQHAEQNERNHPTSTSASTRQTPFSGGWRGTAAGRPARAARARTAPRAQDGRAGRSRTRPRCDVFDEGERHREQAGEHAEGGADERAPSAREVGRVAQHQVRRRQRPPRSTRARRTGRAARRRRSAARRPPCRRRTPPRAHPRSPRSPRTRRRRRAPPAGTRAAVAATRAGATSASTSSAMPPSDATTRTRAAPRSSWCTNIDGNGERRSTTSIAASRLCGHTDAATSTPPAASAAMTSAADAAGHAHDRASRRTRAGPGPQRSRRAAGPRRCGPPTPAIARAARRRRRCR